MKKRLFTFGDSFTQYLYPTWADILGQEFDYYENWGRMAAGNHFIFNSVNECLIRNEVNQNDTFIIMWTNIYREDRYINNQWQFSGNIFSEHKFNPDFYDELFSNKFMDGRGCLLRDLAMINATKTLLDHAQVNYIFLSTVPVTQASLNAHVSDQKFKEENDDILNSYEKVLSLIRPSIYETVFNYDWFSRSTSDRAPDEMVRQQYISVAGSDWPSYENFLQGDFQGIDQIIIDEIFDPKRTRTDWKLRISEFNRDDFHPTTEEHLEYVELMLPEFVISEKTKKWANAKTKFFKKSPTPQRW
jgi:hypothetical protein